uniref:Uncharacterized protein n=1 Tax=Geospiza parvula TaxID=87175 RepID=A0A8C3NJM7_GEOPR
ALMQTFLPTSSELNHISEALFSHSFLSSAASLARCHPSVPKRCCWTSVLGQRGSTLGFQRLGLARGDPLGMRAPGELGKEQGAASQGGLTALIAASRIFM